MTYPLEIGPRLVAARRARRISQRELGEQVGVAQQQIARWEASGYRTAALERVDAVARALGIPDTDSAIANLPLAAEVQATYPTPTRIDSDAVAPVNDLGEIAARIRAHGDELKERFGIARIGVFGSFATGEQTATSDIDLLVEMPEPGGFLFVEAAQFIESVLGRDVDFVRAEGLHERLRSRVTRDVLYVWSA